ncbi:MAG: flagellar hook-length control protein FliK [Xanthomonadales bacterium]|nr:flagellar hook-length control protein FliK [Xanthomonadales bacterium]
MPAQSVATPVAQTPASTAVPRSAPAAGHDADGAGGQFGRQLDAARGQQDSGAATATPDAAVAAAPGPASAAIAVAPDGADADAGHPGDGGVHAGRDDETDEDLARSVSAALLPVFGAALPGAMAHRGALASSAGAQLGVHAAVASGIADAARMLLARAADAAAGERVSGTNAGVDGGVAPGLQAVLSAVRGAGLDDAHAGSGVTGAASMPATQLAPLPAPAAGTHLLAMAAPLGSDGFHQELATQVNWLAGQDVKQARIRIHPEDLGPIDLKVSVSHEHVDVVFSVQHPGTLQALQQSLPQLGQMLAQHGLSLGHAEVGQHGGNDASTPHHGGTASVVDEPVEMQVSGISTVTGAPKLLDAFA